MFGTKMTICCLVALAVMAGAVLADDVKIKISGPGAVDANTIKAGEKVSVDIYTATDTMRTGFTLGFALKSKDISRIIHVADSGNGLNENGDIKGYEGWNDKSVSDLKKTISFEIIVPEPGTLVLDSAYYPPGGKWLFSSPPRLAGPSSPSWDGPHTFKVIK